MTSKRRNDKILDFEYTQQKSSEEEQNADILWKGAPCLQLLIDHPKLDKGRNQRFIYGIIVLVLPFLLAVLVYYYRDSVQAALFVLLLTSIFMIVFIPPYFLFNKYLKDNKTTYILTEKGIIFNLDDGYKLSQEKLEWHQVRSITTTPQPKSTAAIHFLTKEEVHFTSFNFIDKETRQFPSFELLEDGETVFELANKLHQASEEGKV